jgi:hypothetical protein
MNHFTYHSEQVHSSFVNGKGQTRRNAVSIQDGKGKKSVEVYDMKGNIQSKREKELTKTELECIRKNKFIPGLFKDCITPLRLKGKTRRRRNN